MMKNIKLTLIILIMVFLYGCSIKTIVNPIQEAKIASICIQYNDKIFVKEFADGLKGLIEDI